MLNKDGSFTKKLSDATTIRFSVHPYGTSLKTSQAYTQISELITFGKM